MALTTGQRGDRDDAVAGLLCQWSGALARPADDIAALARRVLPALAARLRGLPVPVIGRIADAALLLDWRCFEVEAGFLAQIGQTDRHG